MKNSKMLLSILVGFAIVVVVVAAILVSHNNSNTNTTSTPASNMHTNNNMNMANNKGGSAGEPVATQAVTIQNFAFSPATIQVKTGSTVTWTNQDSTEHSIVGDTAGSRAPHSPLLAKGKSYSFTYTKAGTYAYHCGVHSSMHGSVVVTD